jgi:hypothetical protein
MTRRKGEITARMNERDYPHIVELVVPPNGFGLRLDAMMAFHRVRRIEDKRGRSSVRDGKHYCRWCFADTETANGFCDTFGGVLLQPE